MKNIAIIDIGSNSIRIIIYKIFHNNAFKAIGTEKYPSKLGNLLEKDGSLSSKGIDLTINILKMFKNICKINNVTDIYVIATEAIRKAKNNKEFLPIIENKTGLKIKILSGFEEAFLGYLSVKSTLSIENALIVDIGGSSMEISLMKNKDIKAFISLPLGAIPLTKAFNFYENISKAQKDNLKNFLFKNFDDIPWLKEGLNFPIIGVSSTPRTIGKIYKKNISYPLDITHNFKISSETIESMYENIVSLTLDEKLHVKGLAKEKADIFTASLGAIYYLMDYCNSKELIVSEFGIKEGLLFKILNKKTEKEMTPLEFSLNNIMELNNLNKDYRDKIFNLSKSIYKELNYEFFNSNVLYACSSILNLGFSISLENVHKHSFYMILNSNLYGLSPKEILMCAYTVGLSKKDDFKLKSKYKEILLENDLIFCKRLSIILNLAKKIYTLENNSYDISVENHENTIYIALSKKLSKNTFIKETIENSINPNFNKYFNKNISII